MALFTGAGNFTVSGTASKIHDIHHVGSGQVVVNSQLGEVRGCHITELTVSATFVRVYESRLGPVAWDDHFGLLSECVLEGLVTVTGNWLRIADNRAEVFGKAVAIEAMHTLVTSNIFEGSNDIVSVDGDRNQIMTNQFLSVGADSAVNVLGGSCNMIVGNDLGPVADYATAPIIDGGTDTQLFWPADPSWGDNFTDCATSP